MKLAFSTLGCSDRSLEQIIDCANNFGICGIEIRGISDKMNASEITSFFPENIDNTKKLLEDRNVEFVCFGTSCSFHNKDKFEEMLIEGYKAIDVCQRAGIPAIRIFGDKISSPNSANDIIKRVMWGTDELCKYAKPRNISVYLEVHGDFNSVETVEPVAIWNKKHENFGLIWDVEHSDKVYSDNWRDFYYPLKPYIKHIHIKDCTRSTDETNSILTLIGEGNLPLRDIVKTLKSDGFSGWYSLEWEKKWKDYLPEIEEALPSFIELMGNS